MKKFLFYCLAAMISLPSLAAFTPEAVPPKAAEIFIELNGGKRINMQELADISMNDFEQLSGRKMKLADKIAFRLGQKKLRDNINPDGSMKNQHVGKALAAEDYGDRSFHLGGFALGLLMGLIGVLIAYLINDENKSRRKRWAWIGLIVYVAAYVTIRLVLL